MSNINLKNIVVNSLCPILIFDKTTGYLLETNDAGEEQFNLLFTEDKLPHYSKVFNCIEDSNAVQIEDVFYVLKPEEDTVVDCVIHQKVERRYKVFMRSLTLDHKDLIVAEFKTNDELGIKTNIDAKDLEFKEILHQMIQGVNQSSVYNLNLLIKDTLRLIGTYFESERSYVFYFSEDERYISIGAQWNKNGIIPFSEWEMISSINFQYVADRLYEGGCVCINKMTDFPDEGILDRSKLIAEGVKSVLLVPFKSKAQTLGFMGVDMVSKERSWKPEEVANLKLFSFFIANIEIKRRDHHKKSFHEAISSMFYEESTTAIGIFNGNSMVDCNFQALKMLRCAKKDVVGKTVFDLTYWDSEIQEEQERILIQLIEQSRNGDKPIREWKVKRPDGTMIHLQLTFQIFPFKGYVYLSVSGVDISDRIEKEEVMLLKQKELRTRLNKILSPSTKVSKVKLLELLDKDHLFALQEAFSLVTGIPSVITDAEGNVISSVNKNKSVCELIRQSAIGDESCRMSNEILKNRVKKSLNPQWHKCGKCGFFDAAAPIVVENDHVGTWWIGKVKPVDASKERVLSFARTIGVDLQEVEEVFDEMKSIEYNQFENALHLLEVLTGKLSSLAFNNIKLGKALQVQKRMESKIEKAKLKAEESDKLKSAFLANMSHEIRTPMNGIIGFTELIQNPDLEPDERLNYISIILESSNQLLNIINDIIDISKIEAGHIDVHNEAFVLDKLFKELVLFYGSLADKKGITLRCGCDCDNIQVVMDRVKLKQVFSNLIGNAIKFTHKGCVEFGVTISDSNILHFYVIDTGIGIGEKDQKHIFNRFWQVGKNSSSKGGTGLGLAITKAYVELMGGNISLSSEVDKGTRFNFNIPGVQE